jgi:hypothetical protein
MQRLKTVLKGYPKQPKGCQEGAQIDQKVAKMDSETALRSNAIIVSIQNIVKTQVVIH